MSNKGNNGGKMMQYFWLLLCFYLPLFIMMYACVYMRGEEKGRGRGWVGFLFLVQLG